jgi:hypothetical protein
MMEKYNPASKIPDNSKAGLTVCLSSNDEEQPFEATVYFKKPGKTPEESSDKNAINITASGKLRLEIGEKGFVEFFLENTRRLKEADTEGVGQEGEDALSVL